MTTGSRQLADIGIRPGRIGWVLANHHGFTEEMDFIINYDIKYRMGRGAGEED
jgi:hypothetical protein